MDDYYGEEDGWTQVNYRRGRLQPQRSQPHTRRWRDDQYRCRQPQGSRPTYASIAGGDQRHYGDFSSRPSYRHGNGWRSFTAPPAHAPQLSRRDATPRYLKHQHTGSLGNQRQPRQLSTGRNTINGDTRPQVRVVSDDPDFTRKVRVIYRVMKATHHLKNVCGQAPPPMISKTTYSLASLIKPASPSEVTQLLLEGNAKNWEHTVLLILREHYQQSRNRDIQELAEFPRREWRGPFDVAAVWATKNLGRRLQTDTLQDTESLLVAHLTHQQQPTGVVRDQSSPPETEAPSAAATRAQTHTTSRLQTVATPLPPPPSASPVSVATMTDQRGGDWSPFPPEEDETSAPPPPLLPPVSSPPLSLSHPSPLSPPPPPLFSPPPSPSPSHLLPRSRGQQKVSSRRRRTTPVLTAEQHTAEQTTASTTTPTLPPPPHNTCVSYEEPGIFQLSGEEHRSITPSLKHNTERFIAGLTPRGPHSSSRPSLLTPEPLGREEGDITAPRGATTPRKELQQPYTGVATVTPAHRPTKHGNTGQKGKREWVLCAGKHHLIIGDSNVSRLPPFQRTDLQVDSFPGATFHHAEAILRRSKRNRSVQTLILSFGLNNRHQKTRETSLKQLRGAVRAAEARFPDARILIPEVNFSQSLPLQQRLNLRILNDSIRNHCEFIPHLPTTDFETENGGLRWSSRTASRMLDHWLYQLHIKSLITI